MQRTPEFVLWTLSQACALRDDTDLTDPAQADRQLRVLRSYADALFAGRCWDGICLNATEDRGFRSADVLAAYGGETLVHAQCDACPANVLRERDVGRFAGCFGWLILDDTLLAAFTRTLAKLEPSVTSYHSLWIDTAPSIEQLALHRSLCVQMVSEHAELGAVVAEYQAALTLAASGAATLHWQLFPIGITDGLAWRIATHCPRCKASMSREERTCQACHFQGHCEPERKRKTRGQRPFTPLATFLGEAGARDYLQRYRARV
ncbi:MAG TPA: hypothetical protein VL096_00695 [Pirellulaceae bacterium]|nr:hypothetical protein [Pirellulaceae bacterium]